MVDCPCGSGLIIPPGKQTCPSCGTDLAPLFRLKTLGEQILEERERFAEEKQSREKQISLLKKGLIVFPAVTLFLGFYVSSAFWGPEKTDQLVPQIDNRTLLTSQPAAETSSVETVRFLYTIKKGDTLSKIAFNFYGDSGQWEKIYEANKDILKNPNVISEGTEIIIPPDGK